MADDDEQTDDEMSDGEMSMEDAMADDPGNAPNLQAASDQGTDEVDALLSGAEDTEETQRSATDLAAVYNIPVKVSAVLGRSSMQVSSLLKMGRGAVIELDRKVGEAIDIYVNNRLVARGEVVVVDERLGVTMTEIIKGDKS